MIRDIRNLKIGLVLSGGGAKGAYEAGVIAALWDLGLVKNISAVSGTSIGTVNSLLFCMEDRELLEKSWRSLQYSQFLSPKEMMSLVKIPNILKSWFEFKDSETIRAKHTDYPNSVIGKHGIRDFVEKYIDMEKVKKTSIDLYGCAYNVDKQEIAYFRMNDYSGDELVDICLASCAIPDLLSPIMINGESYIDGGFQSFLKRDYLGDNVPLEPLKKHDCEMLIVVHLDYLATIDRKNYPNQYIVEIFPSAPLEVANGFGTFNLFKDVIEKRIDLGYRDALVSLSPIILAYVRDEDLTRYLDINEEKCKQLVEKYFPLPIEVMEYVSKNMKMKNKDKID